jgi:gliding motility-associated-like protein
MMNAHDAFERAVKGTLEPFEVPYNSADWAQLEGRLDKGGNAPPKKSWGLVALLLGGGAVAGTAILLMTQRPGELAGTAGDTPTGHAMSEERKPDLQPASAVTAIAGSRSADVVEPVATQVKEVAAAAVTAKRVNPVGGSMKPDEPNVVKVVPAVSDAVGIRSSVSEGCPGTSIDFAAENLPSEGIFLWNFGDGSFSNKARPSHVFSKAGTFEVMLSHSSAGGTLVKNKPVADRIVIHELPNASFVHVKQEYENAIPSVHFENRSQGGVAYRWDFGDGSTSDEAHPDHVFKKAGEHAVVLTVTNAQGCQDRMEQLVHIETDYALLAPNTFSPNSDGVGDLFLPEALKTLGARFKLYVHDPRSGQMVYETSDPTRPWNGRIGNKGEPCPPGEYVWMVEMKDGEKLGGTYNGTVGLLR